MKQKYVDATYKISHILRNVYATNMILVSFKSLVWSGSLDIKSWKYHKWPLFRVLSERITYVFWGLRLTFYPHSLDFFHEVTLSNRYPYARDRAQRTSQNPCMEKMLCYTSVLTGRSFTCPSSVMLVSRQVLWLYDVSDVVHDGPQFVPLVVHQSKEIYSSFMFLACEKKKL